MFAIRIFGVVVVACSVSMLACSAQTLIIPNPPDAKVTLEGKPLPHNVLTYGRWIGNNYKLTLEAKNFKTMELVLSPGLGDRAGAIALTCVATVLGIPFIPSVFWNGELPSQTYVSMAPDYESLSK